MIYTVNLNGSLFPRDGILEDHYVTQFRFARDPLAELACYSPIVDRLERQFGRPAAWLTLVGAFDAPARLGLPVEALYETFVPPEDFLAC